MKTYEENLIGNSIPLLETDDEDSELDYTGIDSDISDISDHIGTEEFKSIYQNLTNEIRYLDLEKKRVLCQKLLIKISEIYDFEFTPRLTFDTDIDCNNFLDFVKFLEFDYINELSLLIDDFVDNDDLLFFKKETDLYIEKNSTHLILKIDSLIINNKFSKLISEFFRTNNRDNIINFLKQKFGKDKILIILKTMEGV